MTSPESKHEAWPTISMKNSARLTHTLQPYSTLALILSPSSSAGV